MFFLIGLVVVFGSVITGYLMHHGDLKVLWQPNEVVIILGSAIGASIVGNPISVLKKTLKGTKHLFKGKPYDKKDYMELLLFSFNAFKLMKIKGMLAIESHIEKPTESEMFKASGVLFKEPYAMNFMADNLRLITMGMDNPHQFEDIVEKEIEIYKENINSPGDVFTSLGDALPALGIVAAVLGVITTMKSILEPPDVLGALIAAALVGTFLGVLLAYGVMGPIGHFLHKYANYQGKLIDCAKIGFIAYLNGNPPIIIIEFMRKAVPPDLRPTFEELDTYINENAMKIMG